MPSPTQATQDQTKQNPTQNKTIYPDPEDVQISFSPEAFKPLGSSNAQIADSTFKQADSRFPFNLVSEDETMRALATGNFVNGIGILLSDSPFGKGVQKSLIDSTIGTAGDLAFQWGREAQEEANVSLTNRIQSIQDYNDNLTSPAALFEMAKDVSLFGPAGITPKAMKIMFDYGSMTGGYLKGQIAKHSDLDEMSTRAGVGLRGAADNLIKSMKLAPEYQGILDKFSYDLGAGTGSVLTAIGAGMLNPEAAAIYFGLIQKAQISKEASTTANILDTKTGKEKQVNFADYRDKFPQSLDGSYPTDLMTSDGRYKIVRAPMSAREAGALGTLAAIPEAGLEFIGLHTILKGLRGFKPLQRTFLVAFEQAIQEAAQQGSEEVIAKAFFNREGSNSDIWKRVGYASFLGLILGVPVGAVSSMSLYQSAKGQLMTEHDLNEEEADRILERVNRRVVELTADEAPQFVSEMLKPYGIKFQVSEEGAEEQPQQELKLTGSLKKVALEQWEKLKNLIPGSYHAVFADLLAKDFRAFADIGQKIILLTKNIKQNTVPHEVFHVIYNELLTDEEKQTLSQEVNWNSGITDEVEVEEFLADRFAEAWLGRQARLNRIGGKIRQFIVDTGTFLKSIAGVGDQIEKTFTDIANEAMKSRAQKGGVNVARFQNLDDEGSPLNEDNQEEPSPDETLTPEDQEFLNKLAQIETEGERPAPLEIEDEQKARELMGAEETINSFLAKKDFIDLVGKFRRFKGDFLKEEMSQISKVFFTSNKNAESLDEVADRLEISTDELIGRLTDISKTLKQDVADFKNAQKVLREFAREETARQKTQEKELDFLGRFLAERKGLNTKQIIRESTGQTREENQIPESKALKASMKAQQRAARYGYKAGFEVAREKMMDLMSDKIGGLQEKQYLKDLAAKEQNASDVAEAEDNAQISAENIQAIKTELINYINEQLPKSERGALLVAVRDAETQTDLLKAFQKTDEIAEKMQRKQVIASIKQKMGQIAQAKNLAIEYKDIALRLVSGIDLVSRRKETLEQLQATKDFIASEIAAGRDVTMPQYIYDALQILQRTPASELSIEQLEAIADKLDLVKNLAKQRLASRKAAYDAEKEAIISEIEAGTENPIRTSEERKKVKLSDLFTERDKLIADGKSTTEVDNKIKKLQGEIQRKIEAPGFFDKIKDRWTQSQNYGQLLDRVMQPMDHLFQSLGEAYHKNFKKALDLPFGDYLKRFSDVENKADKLAQSLNLDETSMNRIGIHGALQQEGGREKLITSGFTEKQLDSVKLTPEEEKFYNFMRDEMDKVFPEFQEVVRNVYNEDVKKVRNYFPFMTDFSTMSDLEVKQRLMELPEFQQAAAKNVNLSASKKRVDTKGAATVRIDAHNVFLQHMNNVLYAIHMAKGIKQLQEIAKSDRFEAAAGDLGQHLTVEWLDLMARKGGKAGDNEIKWLDFIRKNSSLAMLALNPSSIAIQVTPMIDAAGFIGQYAFQGQFALGDPEWRSFVMENSPELKNRVGDDQAFREFGKSWLEQTRKGLMIPQRIVDGQVATGVFIGAYMKYMDDHGLAVDLKNPNKEAILYAERVVRETQSSAMYKDLPLFISKGIAAGNSKSMAKAASQFQTPLFYKWANIRETAINKARQGKWHEAANIIGAQTAATLAEYGIRYGIKSLSALAAAAAFGYKAPDDDKTLGQHVVQFLQSVAGNIPFVSNGVSLFAYGQAPITALSLVGKLGESSKNFSRSKSAEKKLKWASIFVSDAIGLATGLPTPRVSWFIKKASPPKKSSSGLLGARRKRKT